MVNWMFTRKGARAVERDGEVWFVGKDVASVLGYSNTRDALRVHVDEDDKRVSRITTPSNGEVWFVAKDVCDVLEIRNVADALSNLDEDEKSVCNVYTPGGMPARQ